MLRRSFLLTPAALLLAQSDDERRFREIRQKFSRGEPITPEERAFAERMMARQREAFAREHPPRESTGLAPLPDLGKALYKGEQGGLYPDGENTPPRKHREAGLKRSAEVVPLDAGGKRSPSGRIVLLSIGMSNTTQEFQVFQKLAAEDGGLNPKLTVLDGAQGGQTAAITANPGAKYWSVVDERMAKSGVTSQQVQVVWLKQANAQPFRPFPEEAKQLQRDLVATLHNLAARYPNLKIAYLSSRTYGGWATTPLNPEPHAYETGFAVKWTIADQIAGSPELGFANGKAPWLAWGPYLWADGVKGRKDGLVWLREDCADDGTHPSMPGRNKVARLLLEFLKTEPTARAWFNQATAG